MRDPSECIELIITTTASFREKYYTAWNPNLISILSVLMCTTLPRQLGMGSTSTAPCHILSLMRGRRMMFGQSFCRLCVMITRLGGMMFGEGFGGLGVVLMRDTCAMRMVFFGRGGEDGCWSQGSDEEREEMHVGRFWVWLVWGD